MRAGVDDAALVHHDNALGELDRKIIDITERLAADFFVNSD